MTEQEKRENVIEALEMSYTYSNVDDGNTLVPQQLVLDIIVLLKEQEPVLITPYTEAEYGGYKPRTKVGKCPNCGIILNEYVNNYCSKCGKAVKWK